MPFNLVRDSDSHLIIKKNIQIPNDNVLNVSSNIGISSDKYQPILNNIKIDNEIVDISGSQLNYINSNTTGILESNKAIILDNTQSEQNINLLGANKVFINGEELLNQDSSSLNNSKLLSFIVEGYTKPNKVVVTDNNKDIKNINILECSSINTDKFTLTSNKIFNERLINETYDLSDNQWNDICWCPDLKLIIAVGNGCIMLTNDGENWEDINTTNNNWVDIKWIAKFSLFIICSNSGNNRIRMSINGYDWFNTNTENTYLYDSIGMDDSYVYVFSSDGSYKTNDGNTWISIDSKPLYSKNSYNGQNNLLLLVSTGVNINSLTSSNLIKNVDTGNVYSNIDSNTKWANITYGNGIWVIVNTNQSNYRLYKSTDSIYWENIYTNGVDENFIAKGIKFINYLNIFVLFGSNGLYYSSDCINWINIQLPSKSPISCLAWSDLYGKIFILTSNSNSIEIITNNLYNINYPLVNLNNIYIHGFLETINKKILYGSSILYTDNNNYKISNSNFIPNSISYSLDLNLYVAVGLNFIYTSSDAIDWLIVTEIPDKNWIDICWGDDKFIAISSDMIISSTDGITWYTTHFTSSNWKKIIYNGSYIVISTSTPFMSKSTDGINWGNLTLPQSDNIIDICYNSQLFIVLFNTETDRIISSSNGNSWISRTTPTSNEIFTSITWCDKLELFIAISISSIMYSNNGIDWEIKLINSFIGKNFSIIKYSSIDKYFILISIDEGFKVYSTEEFKTILFKTKSIYDISTNLDLGLYIEQNSKDLDNILVSIKRAKLVKSNINKSWKQAIYNGNKLIIITNDEQENFIGYSTTNGKTINLTGSGTSKWNSICFGGTKYVIVASTGTYRFLTSTNGINWNLESSTLSHSWNSVYFGQGIYVAVSTDGKAAKSLNGSDWELMNNTSGEWISVISTNDSFVAVGTNILMYTKDKLNWNAATTPIGVWKSLAYGNSIIVAVGNNVVMYSYDSVNWSLSTCSNCNWESVIWIENLKIFVACASTGTNRFMYSLNGIKWISILVESQPWISIVYNNNLNTILLISNSGTYRILSSSIIYLNNKNTLNSNNLIITEDGNLHIGTLTNNDIDYKVETNTLSLYNSSNSNSKFTYDTNLNLNSTLNILNHNGTNKGLSLNGTLVNTPSSKLNYINGIIPGTALKNKALITDSNINISGINTLSCSALTTNVINSITPGIGKSNSPLIVDSDININNINNLQTNELILNNNTIYNTTYNLNNLYNVKKLFNIKSPSIILWADELLLFVAIADNNIYTSYDGENWNFITYTDLNIISGAWSPILSTFVLLSDSTTDVTILTSDNGKKWYPVFINDASNTKDITWSSTLSSFVIISNDYIHISEDTILWVNYTTPLSTMLKIVFSPELNLFVSVLSSAGNNNIFTSTNAVNWTARTKSTSDAFISLKYEVDKFYAITANDIFISSNGITWSAINISDVKDITIFNSTLIATTLSEILIYKDNQNFISISSYGGLYIISNTSKFLVYGGDNLIINIDSRTNKNINLSDINIKKYKFEWFQRTLPSTDNNYIYNGDKFVIVGQDNILISDSGITWESVSISGDWKSISWDKNRYVMVKLNNIAYSTDLTNWSVITAIGDWKYITYINNKFVAVGIDKIAYSPNGVNWNYLSITGEWKSINYFSHHLSDLTNSEGLSKYIMVGTDKISYSTDIINWTTIDKNGNWNSICNGLDLSIISSTNNILYSKDNTNWKTIELVGNWTQVVYIDELNYFILVSNTQLAVSNNGIDWEYIELNGCSSIAWSSQYALLIGLTDSNVNSSQFVYPTNLNTIKKSNLLYTKNSNVGILNTNPEYKLHLALDSAAKLSTSTWIVSSDERIKKDIKNADLDQCYNIVKNLKLKKYKFKDGIIEDNYERLGWMAQEVEEYISNAVTKSNQYGINDCRSLNTDQIISNMYGCIQKLMLKLDEIKQKKEILKSRIKIDLNI